MQEKSDRGHLALCEKLLGLAESQRTALTEGRPDEAEEILARRLEVLERIKLLDGIPPVQAERERINGVLARLQALDDEIQMILRIQMNTVSGKIESVSKSRDFANSAGPTPSQKKTNLNIRA